MVAALISKHRDARASKGRRVADPYKDIEKQNSLYKGVNPCNTPSVSASPSQLPLHKGAEIKFYIIIKIGFKVAFDMLSCRLRGSGASRSPSPTSCVQ